MNKGKCSETIYLFWLIVIECWEAVFCQNDEIFQELVTLTAAIVVICRVISSSVIYCATRCTSMHKQEEQV